jgi:ribonucleoside-diphosphate reductase alpha chain
VTDQPAHSQGSSSANKLSVLGEKIYLDRYALKDVTRTTLTVGDTIIAIVDSKTNQREIGKILALTSSEEAIIELRDGTSMTLAIEQIDKPLELDPVQMMERVARGIASVEKTEELRQHWEREFLQVLEGWKFVPAGRILTAAGSEQQLTYYNCFVIPCPHDSRVGIFKTLSHMTEIMSRGGGVGINLSTLRPQHAYVKGVNGRSSGAVSWGAVYSFVTGLIEQGGSRRGALMLILNDWHPDILSFITSKREMGKITNANISVAVSDALMEAVQKDSDWDLIFPDTTHPSYDTEWNGNLQEWQDKGYPVIHYRTIKARELWLNIIESAWASAEPGLFFIDRANKMSNSWYYETMSCTNPCVIGDTLVSTEHGYTRARDLQVGMKVRTPAGLKPIEKMYNNGLQRIYRVEFSDGGYLEGTTDHKLKVVRDKKYQWVPMAELVEGDKVLVSTNEMFGVRQSLPDEAMAYIAKRELNVADYYDRKMGLIVGTVLGDGTLRELPNGNSHSYQCKVAFGAHEDGWYETFTNLMTNMNIHTHRTLAEKEFVGDGGVVVKHVSVRLECYKLASLLVRIGMPTNVSAPSKTIPDAFLGMEKEFLAGILDGLISTDGSVLMKQDNPMVRFHTSSYALAQQVRLILLQFGIHGRIYRSTRDEDLEYDGRSMYGTGEKYDVIIMNEGIPRFYAEVGLSHPEKAARLKEIAENWHYIGGSWTASVVSIQNTEREEEVYDLYEPETLTWITNGYVSLDCGEQPLPAWGVCNLAAINLAKFHADGNVDYESLGKTIRVAVRFLDNVIDATPYFFAENHEQQSRERRVGLNTMGVAELMIHLGIRYGSNESVAFLDKLYEFIATTAYEASIELAQERGTFPAFNAEKFIQSGFMRSMPERIRKEVKKKGIRNVTLLTQAPNGTIGTMVGTSTGIEPFYSWTYFRKSRLGLHEENVAVVQDWKDAHPEQELPDYFITAMELSPDEHVKVEAAIQRWVDSSISKTCNVPNEYTVEQVGKLYEQMYQLGCKGGTIYRDGSRDEQILMLKKEEKKTEPVPSGDEPPMLADGKKVFHFVHAVEPLPTRRQGMTVSTRTPLGTVHVTTNGDENGEPFEVFITIGKAGSDLQADAEALGRLISLQLRIASPLPRRERLQLIISQLEGIGGSRSVGLGPNRVHSLADAVAMVLRQVYFNGNGNGNHSTSDEISTAYDSVSSSHDAMVPIDARMIGADLCPNCGMGTFIREEGCKKCLSCGYSEC